MSTLNLEQAGIIDIARQVEENITGRVANKIGDRRTDNLEILLQYVFRGGEGNYIEIGSLFGGSAIAVALLKKKLNQSGYVFCIDPMDGYYRKYAPRDDMVDTQSGVPVTINTFFENVKKFGVSDKIFLMRDYSVNVKYPIDMKFKVAFIDGDHRGEVPTQDWFLVMDSVEKYVVFDNCADTHPDVQRACRKAKGDPEWREVYNHDITCVVERI